MAPERPQGAAEGFAPQAQPRENGVRERGLFPCHSQAAKRPAVRATQATPRQRALASVVRGFAGATSTTAVAFKGGATLGAIERVSFSSLDGPVTSAPEPTPCWMALPRDRQAVRRKAKEKAGED